MTILNSLLRKTASVNKICISFIASHSVLLLMMVYTFPVINSQIGTKAFDLKPFGYSVSEAASIVNNLNDQTTSLYLFPQLTVLDLFYPFLLALFLGSLLFRLIKITQAKGKIASIFLIIPFLTMMFDYSENICIILMITKSIDISQTIVVLSSTFTILKGVLTSVSWIAISLYGIKWFRMKILNKNNALTKPKLH